MRNFFFRQIGACLEPGAAPQLPAGLLRQAAGAVQVRHPAAAAQQQRSVLQRQHRAAPLIPLLSHARGQAEAVAAATGSHRNACEYKNPFAKMKGRVR